MAGFTDILGSMIQQGMSPSRTTRVTNTFASQGGSLEDVLHNIGQVLGNGSSELPHSTPQAQTRQSSAAAAGGGVLGQVIGSLANNKAVLGGLGALAAAILGNKSSSNRQTSRKSVGGGWLAMLATLAFSALKQAGQTPRHTPSALMTTPSPQDANALENDAEIIVKAMVNAAKADGQVDDAELQNIIGRLEENGLTEEEKSFFLLKQKSPWILTRSLPRQTAGRIWRPRFMRPLCWPLKWTPPPNSSTSGIWQKVST